MAIPHESDKMPMRLARFLERAEREADEARRIVGQDPQDAFAEFVRAHYDYESVREVFREMTEEGPAWRDDDVNGPPDN